MADPFLVNALAAILFDMIRELHGCQWNVERNVCLTYLIEKRSMNRMTFSFLIFSNASSFVIAFGFSIIYCLSDDGDASFDDDFDKIDNSVSSSYEFFLFNLFLSWHSLSQHLLFQLACLLCKLLDQVRKNGHARHLYKIVRFGK